jgi:hypothetical protein
MDVQKQVDKITKLAVLAGAWAGKFVIVLILIAVLGYAQGFYGVDVQLRSSTPIVQVHVVLFNGMPRLSWRKLVNFTGGLFHASSPSAPASHEQACRQSQKQQVG